MVRPESVHVNATHASTGATCTALFPCKRFCVRSVCIPRFAKRRCVWPETWQSTERQAVFVFGERKMCPEPCPLCALVMALVAQSGPSSRLAGVTKARHQGASQSHLKRTPEAASTWTTNRGTRPARGSEEDMWQP